MVNAHIFAFYCPETSKFIKTGSALYELTDLNLIHRIDTVLRLTAGEIIQLFDHEHNIEATIAQINKKKHINRNNPYTRKQKIFTAHLLDFANIKKRSL